jgi:hypothetical protein
MISLEAAEATREFLPALEKFTKRYGEFLGADSVAKGIMKLAMEVAFTGNLEKIYAVYRKNHPKVEGMEVYMLQLATLCTLEFFQDKMRESLASAEREEAAEHGVN